MIRSYTFSSLLFLSLILAGCGPDAGDKDPHVIHLENNQPQNNEPLNNHPQNNEPLNNHPQNNAPAAVPQFGHTPTFTVIADNRDQVSNPNDLAFHPFAEREFELWVLNQGTPDQGGSTVTLYNAGLENQEADWRRDGNAWHFMSMPPALSFGDNGHWATSVGVQDANHQGGSFAGPSLWSSDMEIYAVVGSPPSPMVNGSHLDMLHGSPFSMGIAHEVENAYWVFDGYHEHIVRYDFQEPHYPGGYDHSDGLIHRYTEVEVVRHPTLPSHMILDKDSGWLYFNETQENRVRRLNIETGAFLQELALINEPLEEHWEMQNVVHEVFIDEGLNDPVGIAMTDSLLFVSNHGTDEIIAFHLQSGAEVERLEVGPGVRGIVIGPDDRLWFVNYIDNQVIRIDPN